MSGKIFGDEDFSVHVQRNPRIKNEQTGQEMVYEGIVYQITCQECDTPIRVGLTWAEVKSLLDGGMLPGVERVHDGWVITAQCPPGPGCGRAQGFKVEDGELEQEAEKEVSRRQRFLKNQNRQAPGQRPMVQMNPQTRRGF